MQSDEVTIKNTTSSLTSPSSLTSFEKISNLFSKDSDGNYNQNLFLVSQCVGGGSLAGFFIGGRIGARIGAVEHIETTTLTMYRSTAHAHRQYQGRVILGFVKNGCRFGWRAGLFSGLYSLLLVTFNEIQEQKNHAANFVYAGILTGVMYKSSAGWRSMLVGALIGGALSVPVAGFTAAVNHFASDVVKDRLNILKTEKKLPAANVENDRSTEGLDQVLKELSTTIDDVIDNTDE